MYRKIQGIDKFSIKSFQYFSSFGNTSLFMRFSDTMLYLCLLDCKKDFWMCMDKRWVNGLGALNVTINFTDTVCLLLIMHALARMLGKSDQVCWNGK